MNGYKEKLRALMDEFADLSYELTSKFPHDEIYGMTSQLRRASLSVALNYIEGFARRKPLVILNFYEISYGSLQESKYLLKFALKRKYITDEEFQKSFSLSEEIGVMLWKELSLLDKN